jgi:hypothetical protein
MMPSHFLEKRADAEEQMPKIQNYSHGTDAWTGAITPHGPPARCCRALRSVELKTNPIKSTLEQNFFN